VVERQRGVLAGDGGGGRVPLQFVQVGAERVPKVDEEGEHVGAGRHVLHHHKAHHVQGQVGSDRGRLDRPPHPGDMGRTAVFGDVVDETAAGPLPVGAGGRGAQQPALFQAAQRRIQCPRTRLVHTQRSGREGLLQVVAGCRGGGDHTEEHLLELGELPSGHDLQA
jgi:hypothetical protein